jgi:hypothetical protein
MNIGSDTARTASQIGTLRLGRTVWRPLVDSPGGGASTVVEVISGSRSQEGIE